MSVRSRAITGYKKGLIAEEIAAWLLRFKGYRIVARRYKTPVGEIDLIARKGTVIVFVEVKARQNLTVALGAVTPAMQRRITRAAQWFVANYPACTGHDMRFDLLALAPPFFVRHLDNAWQADQN